MTANNDLHLDIKMFHMKKIAHDLTMKPSILIDLFVRCHLPPFFTITVVLSTFVLLGLYNIKTIQLIISLFSVR